MSPRAMAFATVVGLAGLLIIAGGAAWAADDREDLEASLFTEAAGTTGEAAGFPATDNNGAQLFAAPEARTVGFSGQINNVVVSQASNTLDANFLYAYTVGDIFLDARLPQNAKVFANLEAIYLSQNKATQIALQEFFLDFNLAYAVYFRTGKQVLQWGRCQLWNPTDLVNVEKPQFITKIGTREGAYGLKMHVPFGTVANLYAFLDPGNAVDVGHTAAAVKAEALLGEVEVAVSGWGKKGCSPVWGTDFSARLLGIDIQGEAAVSQSELQPRARVEDGQVVLRSVDATWYPKASLNCSRSFTPGDFKDQLTVMVEGYYDRSGYAENVLADDADYTFAEPVMGAEGLQTHGTLRDFIATRRLHQLNYFSRAYVACFTSFSRFLLTDMVLTANYIRNLTDGSSLLSTGVNYTALSSLSAGLTANVDFGAANTEYAFAGEKYNLQLTFGISF